MPLFSCSKVVLSCILSVLVLSGCYRQWVSVGYMPGDAEWRSEQRVAHSKLEGNDLKFYVGVSNASRGWDPAKREFALSLRFYLKETSFQFDPRQVRLVIADAEGFAPQRTEMVADVAGWESAWQCGYGPRQKNPGQIPLGREACFEFYFPVSPPSPDESFALRISGLSRDGKPVEIPEVRFKKGSFWVLDFLGR